MLGCESSPLLGARGGNLGMLWLEPRGPHASAPSIFGAMSCAEMRSMTARSRSCWMCRSGDSLSCSAGTCTVESSPVRSYTQHRIATNSLQPDDVPPYWIQRTCTLLEHPTYCIICSKKEWAGVYAEHLPTAVLGAPLTEMSELKYMLHMTLKLCDTSSMGTAQGDQYGRTHLVPSSACSTHRDEGRHPGCARWAGGWTDEPTARPCAKDFDCEPYVCAQSNWQVLRYPSRSNICRVQGCPGTPRRQADKKFSKESTHGPLPATTA